MKKYLIISGIIICTFIGGCATGYIFGLPEKTPETEKVVHVKQVSGEKIEHKNLDTTGKKISFTTVSSGVGEIKTEIDKTSIPEYNYWINKVNIIQVEVDNYKNISPAYLRRFGVFAIGAGVQIPTDKDNEFAVFIVGQFMF